MPTVRFLSKRARENLFRAACFQSRALCATSREAAVALLVLGETRSRGRRRERSERSPHSLSLWRRSFRREGYLKGEGEQFLLIFEKNCYSPCLLGPFGVRHDCTTKFCHRTNQFLMWFFFSRRLDIQTILFVEIERPCLKEKVKKTIVRVSNELPRSTETLGNFFEDPLLCNSFIVSSLLATRNEYHFFFLSRNFRTPRVDFYLENVRIIKSCSDCNESQRTVHAT